MRSSDSLRDRFALIVASGLIFLAPAASAQDVPTAAGQVPRFEPASCPKLPGADELAKASCGYLVVLENRSQPTGRTIRLLVAKYPARSPGKQADPVVYLAGGPGDIAPLEVNGFIAADFIRDRDILVVSQRGTMFSEPALTCAPADDFARDLLGLRFYSEATERAHLAATEACHRQLAATGADLSAYNSTESAADFVDLRKALGIAAWNVYGISYGSYVAQTLMRDQPEGIRSVVLDSVLPTTYTIPGTWWNTRAGFDNLFRACAADWACNAAHPHLEETFTRLVNKLEAAPLTTTVSDPATGKDVKVVLDGGALVDWLRNQNYAVPLLRTAPERIDELAASRPDSVEAIAKDRVGRAPPPGPDVPALGYGLAYGASCREDYPFATQADLAAAGRQAFPDYPASGRRQLSIHQPGLSRHLEGSRRPADDAPAGRQQHYDAPHLWQLRHVDVTCRGAGRGRKAVKSDDHQHPRHRAYGGPSIAVRPDGHHIIPLRSEHPRHILRRDYEATYLHCFLTHVLCYWPKKLATYSLTQAHPNGLPIDSVDNCDFLNTRSICSSARRQGRIA